MENTDATDARLALESVRAALSKLRAAAPLTTTAAEEILRELTEACEQAADDLIEIMGEDR